MKVIVTETYIYEIDVDASTNKEAINKVKFIYDNILLDENSDYRFSADANSHVKTTFRVK
jgi:hypothetical protein